MYLFVEFLIIRSLIICKCFRFGIIGYIYVGKTPMTQEDKARIMAAEAKKSGGNIQAGEFAARAQVLERS